MEIVVYTLLFIPGLMLCVVLCELVLALIAAALGWLLKAALLPGRMVSAHICVFLTRQTKLNPTQTLCTQTIVSTALFATLGIAVALLATDSSVLPVVAFAVLGAMYGAFCSFLTEIHRS